MSDGTSAELFGMIFNLLAENPIEEHKKIAQKVYSHAGEYDFDDYQMYADDACLALGIARRGVNPQYPEDGETVLWPSDDGYEDAKKQMRGVCLMKLVKRVLVLLTAALQTAFFIAKLAGKFPGSWPWVFSPIWGVLLLLVTMVIFDGFWGEVFKTIAKVKPEGK